MRGKKSNRQLENLIDDCDDEEATNKATDQPDYDGAKNYWKVLKFRLKEEGNESVTKCNQLKMVSPKDGKNYKTDVADTEQLTCPLHRDPSCWRVAKKTKITNNETQYNWF